MSGWRDGAASRGEKRADASFAIRRYPPETLRAALAEMAMLRGLAARAAADGLKGLAQDPLGATPGWLSVGREAIAVAACLPLTERDIVVAAHPRRSVGAGAALWGGPAAALGAALAAKRRRSGAATLLFVEDDDCLAEGPALRALCETIAFARRDRLALIVCGALGGALASDVAVDGADFSAVAAAAERASARARAGEGPSVIDARAAAGVGDRDPIARFAAELVAHGLIDRDARMMDAEIAA